MEENVKNPYDKVLKEIFLESSLIQRIGNFEVIEALPLLQLQPETLSIDHLFRVVDKTSNRESVLHIEFQSTNDNKMPVRMLRYFVALCDMYEEEIFQCLIYVGSEQLKMEANHNLRMINYSYFILNVNDISFDELIKSRKIGDIVIALLGDIGERKQIEAIDLVLLKLKELSGGKVELSRNVKLSLLLAKLRGLDYILDAEAYRVMIEVDYKNSVVYQKEMEAGKAEGIAKGKAEGKAEGIHQKAIETARAMKGKHYPPNEISELTGLTIEEIDKL